MIYLFYTIHVLVCLFLILVVLLQQGKGADLSVFGGGATQAAFGARGAVSLLHKLTVWGFVAFIFTTISISFLTASDQSSSVLSDVPAATVPEAELEAGALESAVAEEAAEMAVEEAEDAVDEAILEEAAETPAEEQDGAEEDDSGQNN